MASLEPHPPVIGFVGPSGVGKTTLIERLVPALGARGLRVGVVKHSSHAVVADRPGKDSFRLYRAGAEAVALAMPGQIATFTRRPDERPELHEALAALPDGLDVVLVEGFAWEPLPRYVLLPPDGEDERCDLDAPGVIRALRVPERTTGPPPYPDALIAELASEIDARCRTRAAARPLTLADR